MPANAKIDLEKAQEEFSALKSREHDRNEQYYLLRQAVQGNYRWPRNWPPHVAKVTHNLCSLICERFATYLMGKGFTFNVERPSSPEYTEMAEITEKILSALLRLNKAELQFDTGAYIGSQLGRTVYKVYKTGRPGKEYAGFSWCQPDYFYAIPASDSDLNEFSVVYYSYPIDIAEAQRRYGMHNYNDTSGRPSPVSAWYDDLRESPTDTLAHSRTVKVFEVWTRDAYALVAGSHVVYNGPNPYKWTDTGEGIIPFVVIENIRNAASTSGESDIALSRVLNEQYNYLLSYKNYVVQRWLNPTLVWEGAPQQYQELLANTLGGGGVLPTRLGSRLNFLAYDRPNPSVTELEMTLRQAILESSGMSEIALQGTTTGSVNTGLALATQFQPVLATIGKKQKEWEYGLRHLFAMLLEIQASIGKTEALGMAVVGQQDGQDGELIVLDGSLIGSLRTVVINWPGILPKDDADMARLEMEKASQGLQSKYTTLERLGIEQPLDEIARIRRENNDPSLQPSIAAERQRSQTPLQLKQMELAAEQQSQQPPAAADAMDAIDEAIPTPDDNGLGARLREAVATSRARQEPPPLDMEGDFPQFTEGP